jgi:hypothetical protein
MPFQRLLLISRAWSRLGRSLNCDYFEQDFRLYGCMVMKYIAQGYWVCVHILDILSMASKFVNEVFQ